MNPPVSPYERLAAEYYDASRHPTSANFREASALILGDWLGSLNAVDILEVGAGRSVVWEVLPQSSASSRNVTITDSSPSMLGYSSDLAGPNVRLMLADARDLPFPSTSFDAVVASLGDPYNDTAFWSEASRVLRSTGSVLFTTPSYEWAQAFRDLAPAAEFETREGISLPMPSYVLSKTRQALLMRSAGLEIKLIRDVAIRELPEPGRSWKVLPSRGLNASVVTGYWVKKA